MKGCTETARGDASPKRPRRGECATRHAITPWGVTRRSLGAAAVPLGTSIDTENATIATSSTDDGPTPWPDAGAVT